MADHDQQFIEYVVKNIVDHPDEVVIERTVDERGVLLKLTVNQEDMGKIIGKGGATAKAIRTLLRVLGAKDDARYNLKIVDVEADDDGSTPRPEAVEKSDESESDVAEDKTEAPDQPDEDIEAIKAKAHEGLDDLNMDL